MRSEPKSQTEILYGRRPVQLFLEKSPRRPLRIWIDRRLDPKIVDKFSRLARGRSAPAVLVDPGQIDRLAPNAVHQGVVAEAAPLRLQPVGELVGILKKPDPCGSGALSLLILDSVTDPQNFGAICRTAEGAGINGVIFESKQSPPLGGAAYKASAGALDYLSLFSAPNLTDAVRAIKSHGVKIVGMDAGSKIDLRRMAEHGIPPERHAGFVLGSEGRGIRPQIRSLCDLLCAIPMQGRVGSLNVSAAAAVVCFWRSAAKT